MRRFGTQGPVNPQEHYVVSRTEEIADFINRVEQGKYIVLDNILKKLGKPSCRRL